MNAYYYYYYTPDQPEGAPQQGGDGGNNRPPMFQLLSALISICAGIVVGLNLLSHVPFLRSHPIAFWSVCSLIFVGLFALILRFLWRSADAGRERKPKSQGRKEHP